MSMTRDEGVIRKALSGFYYVQCGGDLVTCRARGKFRYQKITPLVGDRVVIARQPDGTCPGKTASSARRWPTSTRW